MTPLGPKEGLIQWVENSKPLFQIVNGWQQCATERAAALAAEQGRVLPGQVLLGMGAGVPYVRGTLL